MKRLLIGTAVVLAGVAGAAAADLPVKAPPAYTPAWTWTGFYFGGNIGGGWSNSTGTATINTPAGAVFATSGSSLNATGVVGGIQGGYNWQTGPFVLGIESDFDGSGLRASSSGNCFGLVVAGGCSLSASGNINWFTTVRGRVGYAVDRWMFYATGGAAWENVSGGLTVNTSTAPVGLFNTSTTRSGWVVGGGIEAAVWDHLTIGAEYLYINTGTWGWGTTNSIAPAVAGSPLVGAGVPVGSTITANSTNNINVVRLRANYKF